MKNKTTIIRGYTNEDNFKKRVPTVEVRVDNNDEAVQQAMRENGLLSSRDYPHITFQDNPDRRPN